MKEQLKRLYVKRTKKDYSLSLKLQIVKDIDTKLRRRLVNKSIDIYNELRPYF